MIVAILWNISEGDFFSLSDLKKILNVNCGMYDPFGILKFCHVVVQESLNLMKDFKIILGLETGFSSYICSPLINFALSNSWNFCGKILILKFIH